MFWKCAKKAKNSFCIGKSRQQDSPQKRRASHLLFLVVSSVTFFCCTASFAATFFFRFEKFASLLIAKLVHQMEKKVNGKGEKIGYKSTLKSLCRRFQKAFSFDKNETSILKNTYIWCFFKKFKSSRQTRAHIRRRGEIQTCIANSDTAYYILRYFCIHETKWLH